MRTLLVLVQLSGARNIRQQSFFGIANTIEIQHSLAIRVARICDTPELFGEALSFQPPR